MFENYLKVAVRNLFKFKMFFVPEYQWFSYWDGMLYFGFLIYTG